MKPLNSVRYINGNIKKVMPLFISMMVGVMLIYFLSLIVKSTYDFAEEAGSNFLEKYTILYSTENSPIPEDIIKDIGNNSNTEKVIPQLPVSGNLNFQNTMGASSYNVFNLYEEDIQYFIASINLKLTVGKLPTLNNNEILLHERYAKQNNLKVGDSLGSEVDGNYNLRGRYKVSGLVDGPVMLAVLCDNKTNIPRDLMVKQSIIFSLKNKGDRSIVNEIVIKAPKNMRIYDLASEQKSINKMLSINDVLFLVLTIFITFVLSISMSNLSYISFVNRESEFQMLAALGYSRRFLLSKLSKENALVYIAGYFSGILLGIFVAYLLNLSFFEPQGKYLPLISRPGILTALIIPIIVGIISLLPAASELKKKDTVEVIGGTV